MFFFQTTMSHYISEIEGMGKYIHANENEKKSKGRDT